MAAAMLEMAAAIVQTAAALSQRPRVGSGLSNSHAFRSCLPSDNCSTPSVSTDSERDVPTPTAEAAVNCLYSLPTANYTAEIERVACWRH
jgi:hypothetical protein